MDFKQNTGVTIQEAFESFHKLNPRVYEEFKILAFKAINAGKKKISFKMIMNVIRWNVYLKTEDYNLFNQDGVQIKFKINDAYGSRYARLFADDYPEHISKIEFRELRS